MQLDVASITVSAVLPFLLAIINQPKFSSKVKQIIALVAVVIVGIGVPMLNGTFDWTNIIANIGVCFASMQSVYAGLSKTGVFDSIMYTTSTTTADQFTVPEGYNADGAAAKNSEEVTNG